MQPPHRIPDYGPGGRAPTRARARFVIVAQDSTPERLVIRDVGPWSEHPTVTNDAEAVVRELVEGGMLGAGRELLYYDSEGTLDQLLVKHGQFAGFQSARPFDPEAQA